MRRHPRPQHRPQHHAGTSRRTAGSTRSDEARRVADLLRTEISRSRWKLPSEEELIRAFGVSRNSIREALDLLRDEGLLERITGAGTFAGRSVLRHELDLTRLLDGGLFRLEGLERRVLLVERRPAPPPLARLLQIEPGEPALLLEKVANLDGAPIFHATDWFREEVAEDVLRSDHRRETAELLASFGHRVGQVESSLEAVTATVADAKVLRVPEGSPLLLLEVLIRSDDSTPLECSFVRLRADRLTIGPRFAPVDSQRGEVA